MVTSSMDRSVEHRAEVPFPYQPSLRKGLALIGVGVLLFWLFRED